MILPAKAALTNLFADEVKNGARFLEMFPQRMHGRVVRFCLAPGNRKRAIDFFAENAAKIFP
jgi:hypothetical protein